MTYLMEIDNLGKRYDDFELSGFCSHHLQQFLLADQPLVGDSYGIEDDL